jgi:hypothetical protein
MPRTLQLSGSILQFAPTLKLSWQSELRLECQRRTGWKMHSTLQPGEAPAFAKPSERINSSQTARRTHLESNWNRTGNGTTHRMHRKTCYRRSRWTPSNEFHPKESPGGVTAGQLRRQQIVFVLRRTSGEKNKLKGSAQKNKEAVQMPHAWMHRTSGRMRIWLRRCFMILVLEIACVRRVLHRNYAGAGSSSGFNWNVGPTRIDSLLLWTRHPPSH